MSNPNYENETAMTIAKIREAKPVKDSTANTYTRMLRKLYLNLGAKNLDMRMDLGLPMCITDPKLILKEIENSEWRDNTKKNYLGLMLTMVKACGLPDDIYTEYRKAFDIMKASNDAKQEKQEPKENELELKDVSLDELKRSLSTHFNKVRGSDSKDIESAMLNMLGHIHIDQVLRNECATMLLTKEYLVKQDHPETNFIWLKGRNQKLMVIRNNKVRNPALGHEPKEVYLKGVVNTAINKYVQVLKNNYGELMDEIPLVHTKNFTNSGTSGDGSENISSSHYSQVFKKVWEHKQLEITTTMLRKIYAMDVRDKYKGNLIKEKEACAKLDHSKETHDKHYILHFD